MLAYKLKIKYLSDPEFVVNEQKNYSFAYRKYYSNYGNITDEFIEDLRTEFFLDSWQYESLRTDCETKISQIKTLRKQNQERQKEIKKELKSEKNKKKRFKLRRKLKELGKFTNIVFGSKELLRRISFLSNDKSKNSKELENLKSEFQKRRILPVCIGGETYRNGNRKFEFKLSENKVVYKPFKDKKIEVEFICSKKQQKELIKLQKLIDQNLKIPVTIKLSKEYIWIHFDEETLSGFNFDMKEFKKQLKQIPKEDREKQKSWLSKKFREEKESRQLKNKLSYRFFAVDLNPQYIGWCICDYIDGKIRIITKGCYNLSKLSNKLKLSSDNKQQISQNNKRKFEICNIWKDLFSKTIHYKVGYFVMEDLNFKPKTINQESKEFNRKVRNIWHKTLTTNLIAKYCNSIGIQKREINPCYTSFIGNIQHKSIDPINSSIEICRRGAFKFVKGSFFPRLSRSDFDTMSRLIYKSRDVQNKTMVDQKVRSLTRWGDLFYLFKQTGLKYRRFLEDLEKDSYKEFSFFSPNSKVTLYEF